MVSESYGFACSQPTYESVSFLMEGRIPFKPCDSALVIRGSTSIDMARAAVVSDISTRYVSSSIIIIITTALTAAGLTYFAYLSSKRIFFAHPWRSRFPFQRAFRHTLLPEKQKKSDKKQTRSWIFVLVAGLQGINFNFVCQRI